MKTLLCLLMLVTINKAIGHESCACSMGNINLGNFFQYQTNYIGLNYFYKTYSSNHESDMPSAEKFQSLELRGKINFLKKIDAFFFIPINHNNQNTTNASTTFFGIGDFSFLINYHLFNSELRLNNNVQHNLQIGGGLKSPIGKSNQLDKEGIINPNIQLGSGSFDFLLNTIYTLRYKKIGVINAVNYKINTTNTSQYKFGDMLSIQSNLSYSLNINKYILSPNIGLLYEHKKNDTHLLVKVDDSKYTLLYQSFGLNIIANKLIFQNQLQLPIIFHSHIAQPIFRFNASVYYNF